MFFTESFLRKLERLSVMSRRAMAGQYQGERRSHKRGQSLEFSDFRPYSPGDDIRRIDWNAYARLERFFLKLFMEEEDLTVHILIDISRSMNWGQPNKLDYALQTAGALGFIVLAGLDRVTVTVFGNDKLVESTTGYLPPRRGKQSAPILFDFLESYLPENHPDFSDSPPTSIYSTLYSYAARSRNPGPLVIISDLLEPFNGIHSFHAPLNSLAAKGFEITLIHTLSSDEVDPDLIGDLKLIDSESNAAVEITADYDLLHHYKTNLADWQNELRQFCSFQGMHYVPVVTNVPLEELLFNWMRHYAVLK